MTEAIRRWQRYLPPALSVVAVMALALWFTRPHTPAPTVTSVQPVAEMAAPSAALSAWQSLGRSRQFETGLEALPASLDGTDVPDGLKVDSQGRLITTPQLRDIFDYFLSSLGEEDLDTLVARIRAYLANNLPDAAAFEANRILDGYLAWRDNLATIQEAGGVSAGELDLQAVQAQQDAVRASCTRFLDAGVCEVFFAEQQLRDNYDIARLAVLQDDSLSASEKSARVAALTASLPAPMQQQIDAVTRYQTLQTLTTSLQQEGGDAAALRTVREQVVGVEAADRLEQLDLQRAQFAARVDQWLAERAALLTNTGLSVADRDAQISNLRAQRFSLDELTRVQALERIHDAGQ